MSLTDALPPRQSRNMDLIENRAHRDAAGLARIIQYGKFQYEESKKKKDSQARQATGQMKGASAQREHRIPTISGPKSITPSSSYADDLKVRIKLRFRGRQRAHKEFGFEGGEQVHSGDRPIWAGRCRAKMAGDRDLHA
jgi:translation initiation factor IF-3